MAVLLADRVQETSTTPGGTGALTLTGSPVPGYKSFSNGIGTGNSLYYTIYDAVTYAWEVGIGSWSANVLTRTTVLSNSLNTTAFISFTNGNTLNVWVDYPASSAVAQTDIGSAPNQVPLNQYLGRLAFEDVVDTISNNPYYNTDISDVEPTLLLDFVNSKTLDPRITFTRSTTATYYDAKSSAVAEQNLLTYSEQFDNAIWTKTNTTITANSTTAPDGTTTADTLTATAINGSVGENNTYVIGNSYTFSVWILRKTGTGNVTISANSNETGGVVQSVTGTWTRFTHTITSTVTSGAPYIKLSISGDEVYIWGAQLENRSTVTAYTPTTTQAITNYIPVLQTAAINAPRIDYDPVTRLPNGFLVEEARTNLLTYSQFSAGWSNNNSTNTINTIIAPDGTQTGAQLVENTSNTKHFANQIVSSGGTATGDYTCTVYAKYAGRYLCISLSNGVTGSTVAYIDLTTGIITQAATLFGSGWSNLSASVIAVGNGWYRCSITSTKTATGTAQAIIYSSNASTGGEGVTYTGNGYSGIYIWGAQVEAGSFATSYIPTVASQVTRSADVAVMTGTNFSSWYNISQGTLYAEIKPMSISATSYGVFTFDDGTGNNTVGLTTYSGNGQLSYAINGSGSGYLTTNPITLGQTAKISGSFAQYSSAIDLNGGTVVTGTTNTVPTVTTARIGYSTRATQYLNGTIKKLAYYPVALSNAELQEMTI